MNAIDGDAGANTKAGDDTKVCCRGFCAYTHMTGKACPRVATATAAQPRRP